MVGSHAATFASDLVTLLRAAATSANLFDVMAAATREIGFSHFALIHHVDLRSIRPGLTNLNNYPEAWREHLIAKRLYIDDPVVHACLRTNAAFRWFELPILIPGMTARGQVILEAAKHAGLGDGITVPACIPGEPTGSCSFARSLRAASRSNALPLAQLVGAFGFAAARRLAGGPLARPVCRRLSPRQRECVLLVGRGKSGWEIALILGLSQVTVKHYLAAARELFDVVTRTQLVLHALLEGEISFVELAIDR